MAGMAGGGGSSRTSGWSEAKSNIEVPKWLEPVAVQSAEKIFELQNAFDLTGTGGWGGPNFYAATPRGTAAADPLQTWATTQVQGIQNQPEAEKLALRYSDLAPQVAGRVASGETLANDPSIAAAQQLFEKLIMPQIQNQMGLAGLGRSSSLGNAIGLSQSAYMLPMIQDALAREQSSIQNQANIYAGLVPQLAGIGQAETGRTLSSIAEALNVGGTMRGIEQESLDAIYEDFLRRQALTEQALYGPFGATATAAIGPKAYSTSSQSGSSKMSSGLK